MLELPSGTVTLLFTDIEGSTRLLHELGDRYADVLAEHRRVLREAFSRHGGIEVDTQGDSFFVAFARASDAVAAAGEAQDALAGGPVQVRIGIHTGEPVVTNEGYVGTDVHCAARIMGAGHGGQVLLSETTRQLLDTTAELRGLGDHRLKDLTAPQRLYQLGEGDFPPLRTLHRTNLPIQPTPLVGRHQELADVLGLLSEARLVTLTGAGGSGKTRLALQAAAELVEAYPDGVWWVPLEALRDAELVEPTIAQIVGARYGLVEHLRPRRALLLLDNFEQLLEAAPAIAKLLAEAPHIRALATSRERLGIAAEHEYEVPTMFPVEAVALFTARARQLRSAFEPDAAVSEICRRLDGLPLAIELAAARTKVLRPEQILERLGKSLELLTEGARDAPERQRTLRATIAWSYELLDGAERALFARLAVFRGGFDLAAAEEVFGAAPATLAALVDKGLLRRIEEGRFFMLETICEYALEQLEESAEAQAVRRRHAEFFVKLAEQGEIGVKTPEQAMWLERLEAELANLRAALRWSLHGREPEFGLRICPALWLFWFMHGHYAEADRWLDLATSVSSGGSPVVQGRVLCAAGDAKRFMNDLDKARTLLERGLTIARETGDVATAAFALCCLAGLAREVNDFDDAIRLAEEAIELGDVYWARSALHVLGETLRDAGEYPQARERFEESIQLAREAGTILDAAYTMHSLGDLALDVGDLESAEELYYDSLTLAEEFGSDSLAANCLAGLASAAAGKGLSERAARLWGAAERLESDQNTVFVGPLERARYEPRVRAACENEQAERAVGRELDLEQALAFAFSPRDSTRSCTRPTH